LIAIQQPQQRNPGQEIQARKFKPENPSQDFSNLKSAASSQQTPNQQTPNHLVNVRASFGPGAEPDWGGKTANKPMAHRCFLSLPIIFKIQHIQSKESL